MDKTAAHFVAQKKLALPTYVVSAQTVFCADTSFALFYFHIFPRSFINYIFQVEQGVLYPPFFLFSHNLKISFFPNHSITQSPNLSISSSHNLIFPILANPLIFGYILQL
jgi:hypothetical protein